MTFYHSYFFDLGAAGERIQRMANREQVEEATYFVSCRNKAHLIGILCIVCQWVFFQRQFVIPELLTFFFFPVQDHFHAGSVLVKLFLILTNKFTVKKLICSVLLNTNANGFITMPLWDCSYIILLAKVHTVMISADSNCIEMRQIRFNYSDQ